MGWGKSRKNRILWGVGYFKKDMVICLKKVKLLYWRHIYTRVDSRGSQELNMKKN